MEFQAMTTLFLKPKKGARVLDPDQSPPRPLPESGARVTDSLYWRRKIAEGVVEIFTKPGAGPTAAASEAAVENPDQTKTSAAKKAND